MKTCITCGMPFVGDHENDIGFESPDGPVCTFDSENGVIKSGAQIFEGGVAYFVDSVADGDRELSKRITRTNMLLLSHWQAHPFNELDGPTASDEEFATAMSKLAM